MSRKLEEYIPPIKEDGINTDKNASLGGTLAVTGAATLASTLTVTGAATLSSTLAVTGAATIGGALTQTGALTPTGGIAAAGGFSNPTVFHSGAAAPEAATGGTNASVVTTQTYVCEVFVPVNATLTGVSVLNGTAVAGNINVGLANSSGTVVAQSATTTSQTGTTAYQQVPFTSTYAAKGPAKYFVLLQGSNTSGRFRAHALGNFGAKAVTSETYGTFLTTAAYATTTFTADVGPIGDVY